MQNPINYIRQLPRRAINHELSLCEALVLTFIVMGLILGLIAIIDPNALR